MIINTFCCSARGNEEYKGNTNNSLILFPNDRVRLIKPSCTASISC